MPEQVGIYYTVRGNGFPILLIHGFCETHHIWDTFSLELSKHFKVFCIDLPGFGKSKLLAPPFTISDVAEKVLTWLKKVEISSCIVIGHSMGGYVTLEMVEQQPEKFKSFGLFHSTAYADSGERKISRNKVIDFVTRNGVRPFVESFIPPLFYNQANSHIPTVVKFGLQTKPEALVAYVNAMRDRPDRTGVIVKFKGPILFITGEMDGGIAPEAVKKQVDLNPKSVLYRLPEVAHMGMFEMERLTIQLVEGFLLSQTAYRGQ